MLRVLVRTPRRRLAWLLLVVALAWAAWTMLPPVPEARWDLPADEGVNPVFTPDGRTVVTYRRVYEQMPAGRAVFQAGPLVGRDAETGRERYRALEAVKRLGGVELTPDGRRLTVQVDGKELVVLNPSDGRPLAALADVDFGLGKYPGRSRLIFSEHMNPISPDGHWLAYRARGSEDVRLFDLAAGRAGPTLAGARPPMNFSPDGRILAAQTADGHLGFWDAATGPARPAPADRGSEVLVAGLWFAPDGRTLAAIIMADPTPQPPPAAGPGGTAIMGMPATAVALWDVTTGARRPDPPPPHLGRSHIGLSFSPDGRFLAAPSNGPACLWDLSADPPALVPLGPAPPAAPRPYPLLLTPDGSGVLAGAFSGELALFDLATRERRQSFRLRSGAFNWGTATFSSDGRTLLASSQTWPWLDRLPNWTQRWLAKVRGPGPRIHTVAGTFDVATGRPLRSVEFASANGQSVTLPAFAPDGRSFWSVTHPARNEASGQLVFERWSVAAPGPPWWLLGLTATAVGLAVVDRVRWRRKGA
jgi:WD40 repeat protein